MCSTHLHGKDDLPQSTGHRRRLPDAHQRPALELGQGGLDPDRIDDPPNDSRNAVQVAVRAMQQQGAVRGR